jgi:hypothetical protein
MKKHLILTGLLAAGVLAVAAPAVAHHAINAQFDVSQEVKVTGALVKFDHINPHSDWRFNIKNARGQMEEWRFGGGAPAFMRRAGLKVKDDIIVGNEYTFSYNPSRDGSKSGYLRVLWLGDRRIGISNNE